MSTYTSSLGLELITPGSQAGLWGNTTNNSLTLIDQAVTGVTPISFASASGSSYTLTDFNGAENEARAAVLNITGSAIGANTVVIPNKQKTYLVRNSTGQNVTFQTPSPSATYAVEAGYSILIFCDGNNNVFTGIAAPSVGTLSVSGGGTGSTSFGSGGFIKSSGTTNALTASSTVNAATELSGIAPVANGGTGNSSLTSGALLVGNGTGAVAVLTGGVSGYVPTWNGSTWVSSAPAAAGVSSLSAGTGIAVSGPTGAVSVSNLGVLSVSAGTNITLSGTAANPIISATSSGGTVTSVSLSTGSTGLTVGGSTSQTITTSGTFSLAGTLAVANGGTGSTTASGAATNLGFVPKTGGAFTGNVTNSGYFLSNYVYSGTSTSTAVVLGVAGLGSSVNFYAPSTGNGYNSIYFSATSSATANQQYAMSFNNGTGSLYAPFQFNGAGNATALYGSWIDGSDMRIKENIAPVSTMLEKVSKLNPVMYSFKKDSLSAPNKYGLIAQELESVIPEVVMTSSNETEGLEDFKSVAYTSLIPVLIKAIQELKAEVDELKAAK